MRDERLNSSEPRGNLEWPGLFPSFTRAVFPHPLFLLVCRGQFGVTSENVFDIESSYEALPLCFLFVFFFLSF